VVVNGAEVGRYVPIAEGGSSYARKNAIIGGDFSTNPWQRGTSFSAIANATYSADRWVYSEVGDSVHTISKSADAPTVAVAGRLATHCVLVDCTTTDAAPAAGDLVILEQKIEGYNFLPLAQKAMTLSFWHKHTKTGTYCVAFINSGSDRSYVAEYTQAVTDTWEFTTVTVSASPSAGTWDYTTGVGLRVVFTLEAGSTFHTTANAWQTGGFLSTSNQVNAADNTANNFRIALIQLEAGSVATEFESRTVQEETALCQRYYNKTYSAGVQPATVTDTGTIGTDAAGTGAGQAATSYRFPVSMRVNPTIAFYSPGTGAAGNWRRATAAADIVIVVGVAASTEAVICYPNATMTLGELVYGHVTATAEL
jgi:hypothetical protein